MTTQKYYKVLSENGSACHGGSGKWHLPRDGQPGEWMPEITNIEPCARGYHLVTSDQLIGWLGSTIWEAEGRGEHVAQADKDVFGQARLLRKLDRWTDQTARLFAADCAEAVLPIFERQCVNDDRPRRAIEAARKYAFGIIDDAAGAAAGAAAWSAARAAARDAAGDAARAAAGAAAGAAAWDAAGDAARDAARAAARDAAWGAQTTRLWQYLNGEVDIGAIRAAVEAAEKEGVS